MLLTFFSCVQPYYTVRTSFDIPPSEIHFQQEEIALNYRKAITSPLPKDKERLFKKYRPRKEEIWTLSPAPWPSQMQAMDKIDLRTMIWPSTNAISLPPKELMSSSQPEESIGHIQSGSADLYGPSERFSRDLIILRAQIDSYLQSGSVNWSSSLERADFRPIQKDFSFSPPPYDIEYKTQHKTVIDRFAYTQLSIQLASPPIPVYLKTTLALGDGSPTHRILIHPSSVYIGLSNPAWGEVHTDLPVEAVTVDPTGEMKTAQKVQVLFIGSSNVQQCRQLKCTFKPDRTGWHQILATAMDEQGRQSQSYSEVFVYGTSTDQNPEILLSPNRTELLIQSPTLKSDLLLGYLSKDKIHLEVHEIDKGFFLKQLPTPLQKAKALLKGSNQKIELEVDASPPKPETIPPKLTSKAMPLTTARFSYPQKLWLHDRSTMHVLFPAGRKKNLYVFSTQGNISFEQSYLVIEQSEEPQLLEIPIYAKHGGSDEIQVVIKNNKEETYSLPIHVGVSSHQRPLFYRGQLKVNETSSGTALILPEGNVSIHTDTHAENQLIGDVLRYLYQPPTIENRIKRVQVVSLCWDALFHSQDPHAKQLLQLMMDDLRTLSARIDQIEQKGLLLDWFLALMNASKGGHYVAPAILETSIKRIEATPLNDAQKAQWFYLQHLGLKLPIKSFFNKISIRQGLDLWNRLDMRDKMWLIPVLESKNQIRHWVYTQYEPLVETDSARLLMVFRGIREYRYRLHRLKSVTSSKTHDGLLAITMNSHDHRTNRYSLHTFLWKDRKLISRGSHRRRDWTPIAYKTELDNEKRYVLTTRGTGRLRYAISWRPKTQAADAKGVNIEQKYEKKKDGTYLSLSFTVPEKGSYWLYDELPANLQTYIKKEEWMVSMDENQQGYWIQTKALDPGTYRYTIKVSSPYSGTFYDPPALLYSGERLLGQSASTIDQWSSF